MIHKSYKINKTKKPKLKKLKEKNIKKKKKNSKCYGRNTSKDVYISPFNSLNIQDQVWR